ncbi:MAG: hypothetical protein PF795_07325 [Kiritimatiellae bacterium]|jgi:hypothetical protein|nr:hypothetical protein [Kiritimatiellia bacterium]
MIFRTNAQKADLHGSWYRGDRAFFSAGACHILAREFLKMEGHHDFHPVMIIPDPGFRGEHIFARDDDSVFDYHGYTRYPVFVSHYVAKIRRFCPGGRGSIVDISDTFWSAEWFDKYQCRRPHQFYRDPTERAIQFIRSCQRQRKLSGYPAALRKNAGLAPFFRRIETPRLCRQGYTTFEK